MSKKNFQVVARGKFFRGYLDEKTKNDWYNVFSKLKIVGNKAIQDYEKSRNLEGFKLDFFKYKEIREVANMFRSRFKLLSEECDDSLYGEIKNKQIEADKLYNSINIIIRIEKERRFWEGRQRLFGLLLLEVSPERLKELKESIKTEHE